MSMVQSPRGASAVPTQEQRESAAVDEIDDEVKRKLDVGSAPDYITVRGSGEPMANSSIGDLLGKTKSLTAAPLAVLTNGSLPWTKRGPGSSDGSQHCPPFHRYGFRAPLSIREPAAPDRSLSAAPVPMARKRNREFEGFQRG
jgi:hypothetical protein